MKVREKREKKGKRRELKRSLKKIISHLSKVRGRVVFLGDC
jgi:hypothetical protein